MRKKMKCQYCGSEAVLPFKCPFCSGYFCSEHRLPEKHTCPEIWKALQRRREQVDIKDMSNEGQYYDYRIPSSSLNAKPFGFSRTELKHLAIGMLIVIVAWVSFVYDSFLSDWEMLIGSVLIFASTFILHEIAHKIAAQHYGLWAEFRLTLIGSLITLLSMFSPLRVISPGVVQIAGIADKRIIGKVSLAGPATNIVLSVAFLSLGYGFEAPFVVDGAFLNSWIALFNLIPISVFDGRKIFWWDKKTWAVSFVMSIVLTYLALSFFAFL